MESFASLRIPYSENAWRFVRATKLIFILVPLVLRFIRFELDLIFENYFNSEQYDK
jgi:DNA helicase HerA-like ATPase